MSEGGNIGGHICLDLLSEVVSYDPETGEMFCSRAAASTAGFDARSTLYPGFVGRAV